MLKIEALYLARHIGRADHRQGMAVELEIVVVDAEMRTGTKIRLVANPEGGMVDGANLITFHQLRLDEVEALAVRGCQRDRFAGRQNRTHASSLRWLPFR